MENKIIRATGANHTIRGFFADTTQLVETARQIHAASPVAIAALGRVLTITAMMGLMHKEPGLKLTVRINGGGPLGTILVIGNDQAVVKGYAANPQIEADYIRPGKLNVGAAVGTQGELKVVKDLGFGEPYGGSIPLVTGEIGDDFATYFLTSEQQPSAVAVGVLIDVDYRIKAAGGFILQVLPEVTEETLTRLEARLKELESITELMDRGMDAEEIMNHVLAGFEPTVLQVHEPKFECDCSEERLERALISIGRKELTEILEEDGGAEMTCHFCNRQYYFGEERLQQLLDELKNESKER